MYHTGILNLLFYYCLGKKRDTRTYVWCVASSLGGLLLLAGGLTALQAASTIIAVPFSAVLLLMLLGLLKSLWQTETVKRPGFVPRRQ